MNVPRNKSSSVLMVMTKKSSKATRKQKSNAKCQYEKPRISVYSKEGKDFWCD